MMKTMFLAAAAALLVFGGVAQAKVVGSGANQPHVSDSAMLATNGQPLPAASPVPAENPTGLPSYEMRPDGLMINGLLPANGWQG
jgi:hypothetical protein